MRENLLKMFRSHQKYIIWIGFGLFGTEIHKPEMSTRAGFKGRKAMFILARPHT